MTTPAPGTLAWFEVATSDPDAAEKFYGSLFDWSFQPDGPAASGGMDYRNISASGAKVPMGGIFGTSYASCGGVAAVLPVDVTVPGCPPPPLEILRGILTAVRRRK